MNGPTDRSVQRLETLIGLLRDGHLSSGEAGELRELLNSAPNGYRHLAEHMFLASALEAELPSWRVGDAERADHDLEVAPRVRWHWVAFAALAAMVLILFLIWPSRYYRASSQLSQRPQVTNRLELLDRGVAVLTQAAAAHWSGDGSPLNPGTSLPPGRVKLDSGLARIEFYSGATILLEGKADLEILSSTEAVLNSGKLRALVPPHARGFTVRSREIELVDRGTEFGIGVDELKGTQIHVFQGKVDLFDPSSKGAPASKRELTAGAALHVDPRLATTQTAADPGEFRSLQDLEERSSARLLQQSREWREYTTRLKRRPRLVAYYPFERDATNDRILHNLASSKEESANGSIVGCNWAQGRWPGKEALEFKRPGDRVRITLPDEYESITLTAWVRIDGFDNLFNSLILSDGWKRPGAVHWQFLNSGELEFSAWIRNRLDPDCFSKPVFTPYDLGRWMHLASVYDHASRTVIHYVDGTGVGQIPLPEIVRLKVGVAQIGNWDPLAHHDSTPIRNFNGRIDEIAIFSEALTEKEIKTLYETGRPQI